MKPSRSEMRAFIAGIALIVITNVLVLGLVAYNRQGEPESVLLLTERELQFSPISRNPHRAHVPNGADLHLHWRVHQIHSLEELASRNANSFGSVGWLKEEKLRELGFDWPDDLKTLADRIRLGQQRPIETLLVLEYDGPAFETELALARKRVEEVAMLESSASSDDRLRSRLQQARSDVEREERYASRLFVVDAGSDARALRIRYPDRMRYAIVGGRLGFQSSQTGVRVAVEHMDIGRIRIPHPDRTWIWPSVQYSGCHHNGWPRYAATVNFGRRSEPWITGLSLLPPQYQQTVADDNAPK